MTEIAMCAAVLELYMWLFSVLGDGGLFFETMGIGWK